MNQRKYLIFLSLISSFLFATAWPCIGNLSFLIFIVFIPVFFLEDYVDQSNIPSKKRVLFNYSYLTFFLWNALTTWWIYHASFWGAVMAIALNSLFMALLVVFFHLVKKKLGISLAYFTFIVSWLSFEYIHYHWDIAWPWLNLGNSFATSTLFVQWYEFTGVLGGTLWILMLNVLIYFLVKKTVFEKQSFHYVRLHIFSIVVLTLVPSFYSIWLYNSYMEPQKLVDVVVVQPNSDPYAEKFDLKEHEQIEKLLSQTENKLDTKINYLVFPETALSGGVWEEQLEQSYSIMRIREFLQKYPQLNLVIGASSNRAYINPLFRSATSRPFRNGGGYYDSYNTAIQLNHLKDAQLYHKSKLVPGVELTPFPAVFGHLEMLAIELGGASGSLAIDSVQRVFNSSDKQFKAAPIICYESVFGEHVAAFIKNGASFIFIITNDGWWGDTPGYKQHLNYAKLRAIETRRSIARSGNTGISAFINPRGDIESQSAYWVSDVMRGKISAETKITFYVTHGDYIGKIASVFLCFMLVLLIFKYSFPKFTASSLSQ